MDRGVFYPVDPELNPDDAYPPTAFSATLVDVNGHISGSTTEPDIQSPTAAHIQATLDGYRERTHVFFTKFPQGRQTHTIDYHGDIAPDGNAISGTWTIYGEWSGPFLMQRGGCVSPEIRGQGSARRGLVHGRADFVSAAPRYCFR